jgi:lipopolysaccharide/colanic/teichoic acid biosynthesis glycosyltransferase
MSPDEKGKNTMNLFKEAVEENRSTVLGSFRKPTACSHDSDQAFYDEIHFRHMLRVERMRTERSKKPFILLLLNVSRLMVELHPQEVLSRIQNAMAPSLREIDIRGWYHDARIIGVLFTEVFTEEESFADFIIHKIYDRFCENLEPHWINKIEMSCHRFPEESGEVLDDETFNIHLYPDMTVNTANRKIALGLKKVMDILGSGLAVILFSPLFLMIAAAIKATSPGPVFYRQERVGRNGKTFAMLKFRSMTKDCDPSRHQDYVRKFICEQNNAAVEPGVFKLTNDSRITPIGHFLRKTSLDELPQFINVLKGEMSLVGPRPPLPYECELYDIWHRRRLLSCMPGITGLWQVLGRSRTCFDDMVRLDLHYIRTWSLGLDIRILLMTPKAVIKGSGAL